MRALGAKFWIEVVVGGASALAFMAFLLWPTWIESLLGVSPDGGSGETEFYVAVGLALVAIASSLLMRVEFRRRHAAATPQE